VATVTRSVMVRKLKELYRDGDDDVEEMIDSDLEGAGVNRIEQLSLTELKSMYTEYIESGDDCVFGSSITGKSPAREARAAGSKTKKKGIKNVEQFDAEVILDKRKRSVTIVIEDQNGKFLDQNGERHDRALGAEMPIYMVLPQEIYEAIRRA
jgi:hypothetical protein